MEKFEDYRSELIGSTVTKIYHTDQGEGIEHLNGLGNAYYFSTILEIENEGKYVFGSEWIDHWKSSEKIIEVTHKNWNFDKAIKFNNIRISDIIKDEHDEIYIKLENNTVIYHSMEYGDKLYFDKYSDLFDSNGKLLDELTTKIYNNRKLPNQSSWWSKLKKLLS